MIEIIKELKKRLAESQADKYGFTNDWEIGYKEGQESAYEIAISLLEESQNNK